MAPTRKKKKRKKKRWRPPVSITEQFGTLPDACQIRHLLLRLIFQDKQICLFQICTKSRCSQPAASSLGPGEGKSRCVHAFVCVCMCVCVRACIEHMILCSICLILQSQGLKPTRFLVHGNIQTRILEWIVISSSRESSLQRDQTCIFRISFIGRWILCHWAPSRLRAVSWIYNPVGLWTQNLLVFKPRCFGEYLRCKSQNLGLSNVFKPFIPGREPLSLFPTVRVGFLMKLWPSLLQPLHCGPFLICQMDRSGSVFRAFSRGSCSICKAVNLVGLWEVFLICKWHINYSNYSLAALAPDDKI